MSRPGPLLRRLPNVLTVSRLVLTAVLLWLMSRPGPAAAWLALGTFVAAALSDAADGYLARRYRITTAFGIFMDPLADKVLVLSVLLMFVWNNLVPVWMVVVILARESLVTGVRVLGESRGVSLPAISSGKHKMLSQTVAIVGILLLNAVSASVETGTGSALHDVLAARAGPVPAALAARLPALLVFVAMLFSVYSGFDFVRRNRRLFRPGRRC